MPPHSGRAGAEEGLFWCCAVAALKLLAQSFANFKGIGLKGWDFSTSPCQGWSGVTCNSAGRVVKLCAAPRPTHQLSRRFCSYHYHDKDSWLFMAWVGMTTTASCI